MEETNLEAALSILFSTFPEIKEAKKIVHHLIKTKKIACANLFSPCTSVFCWKGEVTEEKEIYAFLKVPSQLVKEATKEIQALHPYEVPCILELPVKSGNPSYIDWALQQVHSKA